MKKSLILAACVSVALASCVNDDRFEVLEKQVKISFSTPVSGSNTRVLYGEIEGTYPTGEKFRVFGLQHEGTYAGTGWDTQNLMINNDEVEYNLSYHGWETVGKTYFWPAGKKMTFGAYSPSDAYQDVVNNSGEITYNATGLHITKFKVNTDPGKQYDLMYSEVSKNRETSPSSSTQGYNGVDINFHHALSSVNFYVKLASNVSSGSIKNVKINNVKCVGDFNQNIVWNDQTTPSNQTLGSANWTRTDETASYVVLATEMAAGADPVRVGDDMILMPQPFEGIENATITLDYKLGHNPWVENYTIKISSLSSYWIMGKRYNYAIVLGGSGVTPIYFAPVVNGWSNEDKEIKLP